MTAPELATERLLLRRWRESDHVPFARLNGDPVVMEHFPSTLDETQSSVLAELCDVGLAERDYGLWAVEVVDGPEFIGFVGLSSPSWEAVFTPCIEIGWRLDRPHWGHGYATEAAREVLRYAFEDLGLDEVVSFTTLTNTPSSAVMERLGMTRDPAEDFDHPNIESGHPLRRHLLCRVDQDGWRHQT
ncbi:MAG: GNAT family N-acetyltransferase [Actinomycetota bacterium]|nr:GNAT family N-acetyltransferase [Actinomycetota bacterium]